MAQVISDKNRRIALACKTDRRGSVQIITRSSGKMLHARKVGADTFIKEWSIMQYPIGDVLSKFKEHMDAHGASKEAMALLASIQIDTKQKDFFQ